MPKKAPTTNSLHVVRDGVVDRVCKILGGEGGPAVAALTGRSGAGKTTAAATMVGERGPIRPRAGETEDQARTRLDRVRALFPDGVVWLRVGKGQGATDLLLTLMSKLAKELHMMLKGVDAPELGEDGGSYVKRIVEQESLRCLVVADNVWESSVVQELRETGMWVLLTTRFPGMVGDNERVDMDKLTETEAEDVLRRAAELPRGERPCDDAMKVLKICGFTAMDIAFVGSWSTVRTTDDGKSKSEKAWERTVRKIEAEGGKIVEFDADANRFAVLRAGFKYLQAEDPLAHELYVALAVFPDDHSFGESDAAVLLGDEEVTTGPILILERWAVLRADAYGRYRMHDAHVDFAREKLTLRDDVRKPAVERWTNHISRLNSAVGIDVYALLRFWRALEEVGGKGWWALRPYDEQLVEMDASDASKILAVCVVAELYEHDRKFGELEELMRKVLKGDGGNCREVQMAALYYTMNSLGWQGRFQESKYAEFRLGKLAGPGVELQLPSEGTGFLQVSVTFSMYGACAKAAGLHKDAEELFRKALKAHEDGGLTGSYDIVWALHEMGVCAREARRLGEAEGLFKRALEMKEAKLGRDDAQVAVTLHEMGVCVWQARRLGEAEMLFKRALEIKEAKLGRDDVQVAVTLHEMGVCAREARRLGEAEMLFKRALEILEAKLGRDDVQVAYTLKEMGVCVRQARRLGEAEMLFKRALEILEAKLGRDDVQVAVTLHEMGVCAREARRKCCSSERWRSSRPSWGATMSKLPTR